MFKTFILPLIAACVFAGAAQATTIDILLGAQPRSADSFSSGGALNPDINLSNDRSLHLNDARVLSDFGGRHSVQPPAGPVYDNTFLDVFHGGSATFNLPTNGNSFGLTWADINPYNKLLLTDSRGVTYKITGAQIEGYLSSISACGCQANVVVDDPFADIVKVQLVGGRNSTFEAANFSVSAVPLPGSALLFALALSGLGFVGYRNRQKI